MGLKLTDSEECNNYRRSIKEVGERMMHRTVRPWLYNNFIYSLLGYRREFMKVLDPTHKFTNKVIKSRRANFLDTYNNNIDAYQNDENM